MAEANDRIVTCVDMDNNQHHVPVSELSWRPSTYGIIIADQKILLSRQFGKYALPGGGINLGEMLEEALLREVKEETGITANNPRLLGVESNLFKLPDGTQCVHSVLLYYACDFVDGELSVDGFDEYEQINAELAEWVDLDTIDSWQLASSVDFRPYIKKIAGLAEAVLQ